MRTCGLPSSCEYSTSCSAVHRSTPSLLPALYQPATDLTRLTPIFETRSRKARKAGMPESMIQRVLAMATGGAGDASSTGASNSGAPSAAQSGSTPAQSAETLSMNEVMEGIKQAVESGGADPSSNMRLQFVMQKARDGGVDESMLERVLGMVSASVAPPPAPLGSAPVARAGAAPVDDADEEPELTEEDLAAMREDVLESIMESVQRSGRDLSQNLKLGFMLKRASGMGIPDSEIEEALGGPIPTGTGSSAAGSPAKPPPVAASGGSSAVVAGSDVSVAAPAISAEESLDPPARVPLATDVVVGALMPVSSQQELVEMSKYQRSTYAANPLSSILSVAVHRCCVRALFGGP